MRIECPHCHHGIDVVLHSPAESVSCPECGSTFSLFEPDGTVSYHEREQFLGRFRLIDHLGSGHFGDVWKAHDATLDREVALKVPRKESMSDADIARFVREARVAAQLAHPNVVRIHEVTPTDGRVVIVSELIRGVNLARWLADTKPDAREAARLCAALADALHHAHEAGIIHRDLKPANVLLDGDGQPHLTDFGLAKRDGGEITMTVAGQILGTPAYMPPEQASGDAHNADRRSDVYSLGVMLYEMLTGERPFKGSSKVMLIHQVLHTDAPRLRKLNKNVPIDLETICLKALEKAPSKRYQTAKEMGDDLRRYLEGKPILARRITRLERGWRWAKRNPSVAALSTTAAALLVLVVALGANSAFKPEPPETRPRKVSFTTSPPGAKVTFVPIDIDTGLPIAEQAVRPKETTPLTTRLRPGRYLVIAVIDKDRFHEVYRTVPAPADEQTRGIYDHQRWETNEGAITLPAVNRIPTAAEATAGLVHFAGGEFDAGDDAIAGAPRHRRSIAPFWLAPTEVTVAEYRRLKSNVPDGLAASGGPKGDDDPVTFVNYHNAIDFAEALGQRLPTEWEYEFAATNGGTTKYPWGDDAAKLTAWPFGPIRTPAFDKTRSTEPIFGLYSGVAEWTDSRMDPKMFASPVGNPPEVLEMNRTSRVIRGGHGGVAEGKPNLRLLLDGPRYRREANSEAKVLAGLGFRCARSAAPGASVPGLRLD